MPKRATARELKKHRSYTIDEAAQKTGVAKGTVSRWLKGGKLPAIMERRPYLIQGQDLIDFLKRQRAPKRRCRLDECYCFSCREVREPAGRMADLVQVSAKIGDLQTLCGHCAGMMHKRVSLRHADALKAALDLTFRLALPPIKK